MGSGPRVIRKAAALALLGIAGVWSVRAGAVARLEDPKNILILNAYGSYQPAVQRVDQGLRNGIATTSPEEFNFHFEYLDIRRPQTDADLSMLARHLREKFHAEKLSAIVTISDTALIFLRDHKLFPGVPVVAYTQRQPLPDAATTEPNVVRVWEGAAAAETLDLAFRLHAGVRRLVVVSGRPGADRAFVDEVEAQLQPYRNRLDISFWTDLPEDELLARVRELPKDALILVPRIALPNTQPNRLAVDVYRRISAEAPVPVYGLYDVQVGWGIVGAQTRDLTITGAALAQLALDVARGTPREALVTTLGPTVPIFDDRELRRWDIDRSLLPVGAIVRFHQPGFWEQYRAYVAGAIGICLVQAGFIGALLLQRHRRQQVEARNDAILRAIPDMMFLQKADGTYLDYYAPDDDGLLATPKAFLGRNMRDVLPPDTLKVIGPAFQRAAQNRVSSGAEYELEMPDGARHFEARIVPCSSNEVLSVVRDVSKRKHAEMALRRSQARYELATAGGGVGVWDLNLDNHEVYVDPALRKLLGFPQSGSADHVSDWIPRVHSDDRPVVLARGQALLRGETDYYEGEHRMIHEDGSIRWFLARGSLVHPNPGGPRRLIGTCTDITRRKESELALSETREELARVSRLTALGEFAASIAHEVRQPLAAILTNAHTCLRFLRNPQPNVEDLRAAIDDIVEAGKRADDVIVRNRSLFRHGTIERRQLDLNATVSHAAVIARGRLQNADVTLELQFARELPPVFGDGIEIEQVLLNLIMNGIEAMEAFEVHERRLVIATALTREGAQVSVRDAGVGLDGVDRRRMFATSYTTKASGTGVGLSVSRAIVEAHGGRIWAEQNDGPGATFYFSIPTEAVSVGSDATSRPSV